MENVKKYTTLSIGVILLAVVIGFSIPQTGHGNAAAMPPDKDVRVINLPTEAIPVRAVTTTTVNGTVAAQQSGTWNVGIAGTPTVAVVNNTSGPLVTRDIDRPTAQPFKVHGDLVLNNGQGGENAFVVIPAGKVLVIEHVSANGFVPNTQIMDGFSILARVFPDPTLRPHYFNDERREFPGGTISHTVSESVRIYAQGQFAFRATRQTPSGSVTIRYTVSGYLVDE